MNPVDIAAVAILILSAVFGLARGLAREVFGLVAWVAAIFGAIRLFGLVDPTMRRMIENVQIADAASYALLFVVLLVVFSVIADLLGRAVRLTPFGGLDRVLGVVFGVVRGAAILVAAYVLVGLAAPPSSWPSVVKQARATPLVYRGAVWAVGLVPQAARPHVAAPDAAAVPDAGGAGKAI